MAAGVGKTYRMLQEGHAEQEAGRDVVIGYMEPHTAGDLGAGRGPGDGSAAPRHLPGHRLEEMDLPALLARAPELALIDELAHTNAPGVEHAKRYEDVRDVLAAGIDVFSTVNVQHLESLNDQVAELTGTRVRETIPDAVLGEADEVVLIDLTPEALIARLRAGKVYPGENIEAALGNFFTVENLLALREVALRQVAQEVEAKRLVVEEPLGTREERVAAEVPKAVGERMLALIRPQPSSQRLVRRAWRSAQRLGADLDLLWVKPPGQPIEGEVERQVTALRHLASVLGANFLIEESDDLVGGAARVVRERGTTYIMVGESEPPRGLARLREPLPLRLMRRRRPGWTCGSSPDRGAKEDDVERRARADRRRAWSLGLVAGYLIARSRLRGRRSERPQAVHQILLPFTGTAISRRAVDAALRLARAEDATLMPAYLAAVPKRLPLDCAIPAEAAKAMPMLEAIEQRAASQDVAVDARIERGAPIAMPWSGCSRARASIASSSRRRPRPAPASPATTSSGSWRRLRLRC